MSPFKKPTKKKKPEENEEAPLFDRLQAKLEKLAPSQEITTIQYYLSSGSYLLDMVLTNGRGWPLGRMAELYGFPSAGKTSLVFLAGAAAQRAGGVFIYIAAEPHIVTNREWMEKCGVAADYVLAYIPETIEACMKMLEEVAVAASKSDLPTVVGFGSIAAITTQHRLEGGSEGVAEASRIISAGFRGPMMRAMIRSKVLILVENQLKQSIGHMGAPRDATWGGGAPEFNASIRLKVGKNDYKEGEGKEAVVRGSFANILCTKNNVRGQGRGCSLIFKHDRGLDEVHSIVQHLKDHTTPPVHQIGAYIRLENYIHGIDSGSYSCHGWDQVKALLASNPAAMEIALQAVHNSYNPQPGLLG